MDDERLRNPPIDGSGVPDYFDELLERIRDIRASERRMYLRVREIFALAGDYDPARQETAVFFQTIQNKLHFAATGMTAPELIAGRADHTQPNMGLTSWKGGVVRKADVTVAKNYLNQNEITELNRIGEGCHQPMWTGTSPRNVGASSMAFRALRASVPRALNARSFRQSSPHVADRGASIPDCGPGSTAPAPAIRPASGTARSVAGGPAPAAAVPAPPIPSGSTRRSIRPRSGGRLRGGWPPADCGSRGSTGPVV